MIYPWEKSQEQYKQLGKTSHSWYTSTFEYTVVEQQIDDSPFQSWRKGDIVKFRNHLVPPLARKHWSGWFVKPRDKKRFWVRNPKVPKYASNHLAIIIGRYRRIKLKYKTFIDYGVILMMLTGPKAGHIRRWWGSGFDFEIKCHYPNNIKLKYMLNSIPPEVITLYNRDYGEDSNEVRNQLCHEIYKIYHGEEL
jgi:hypothetical protein